MYWSLGYCSVVEFHIDNNILAKSVCRSIAWNVLDWIGSNWNQREKEGMEEWEGKQSGLAYMNKWSTHVLYMNTSSSSSSWKSNRFIWIRCDCRVICLWCARKKSTGWLLPRNVCIYIFAIDLPSFDSFFDDFYDANVCLCVCAGVCVCVYIFGCPYIICIFYEITSQTFESIHLFALSFYHFNIATQRLVEHQIPRHLINVCSSKYLYFKQKVCHPFPSFSALFIFLVNFYDITRLDGGYTECQTKEKEWQQLRKKWRHTETNSYFLCSHFLFCYQIAVFDIVMIVFQHRRCHFRNILVFKWRSCHRLTTSTLAHKKYTPSPVKLTRRQQTCDFSQFCRLHFFFSPHLLNSINFPLLPLQTVCDISNNPNTSS